VRGDVPEGTLVLNPSEVRHLGDQRERLAKRRQADQK